MRVQSLEIPGIEKLLSSAARAVCVFAQEMLDLDEKSDINSEVLYLAFINWALEQKPKQPTLSRVSFGRLLLNATGLFATTTREKGDSVRVWHGVRIKNHDGK